MKIVIAPDSFKESMSAREAAEAIQEGFSKILPSTVEYDLIPMADGGEGTTEALMEALNAKTIATTVKIRYTETLPQNMLTHHLKR